MKYLERESRMQREEDQKIFLVNIMLRSCWRERDQSKEIRKESGKGKKKEPGSILEESCYL